MIREVSHVCMYILKTISPYQSNKQSCQYCNKSEDEVTAPLWNTILLCHQIVEGLQNNNTAIHG